jgi:hypothetical protein
MPVLPCGRLHALKIEEVLLAGFQIIDVKRADDLLPVNHVSRIGCSAWCGGCLGTRWFSDGRECSRCANSGGNEIAAIEAIPA